VPGLFTKLAAARNHHPSVTMLAPSSYSLQKHYDDPDTRTTINSKKWDYVVLQGQSLESTNGSKHLPDFFRDGALLNAEIKANNPKTNVLLYETWAYPPQYSVYPPAPRAKFASPADMLDQIRMNYARLAANIGAGVVPVGDAFAKATASDSSYSLHDKPASNYHANDRGYYLSALMFFQAIYRESPRGLPPVMTDLTADHAMFLQNVSASFKTRR
jgi:hypothetical protein